MNQFSQNTYLDYAATTPVDTRVLEDMLPYFQAEFGNPSSIHLRGQKGEAAVETAREALAKEVNCQPHEVIFTSCGSESDNLAIRGAAFAGRQLRSADHILISPVEHHAVSRTAEQLSKLFNFELEYLPVDEYGMVSPEDVASRLRPSTAVVSIIYANNEIGTINPIGEIGKVCQTKGVPFHTDAVQAAGYLSMDVEDLNVDMLSLGAHKFYGPKGIGALFIRKGTHIIPIQTGGSQEYGYRSGTHNVPYIIGMAKAFQIAQEEKEVRTNHIKILRDYLITRVLTEIPESRLSGHPISRLPNHTSFVFHNVDGNSLLVNLDALGYAVSSGSACKTGNPEPSEVLLATGIKPDWAMGSLRVTLGSMTTLDQIDGLMEVLPKAVARNRHPQTLPINDNTS